MNGPALIPRSILFGGSCRYGPQVSPDGKYLGWIGPDDRATAQIWLRGIRSGRERMLTRGARATYGFSWAFDGRHMLYQSDAAGHEDTHIFALDVRTNRVRDLTPFKGVTAEIVATSPRRPHELLVGMNRTDRKRADVYRLDLRTGRSRLDTVNPGGVMNWAHYRGWGADANLEVRSMIENRADGGWDFSVRDGRDSPWRKIQEWGPDERGTAAGFSGDGRTLYLTSNRRANATRLVAIDLATSVQRVVASDPEYDVSSVIAHPLTGRIAAVSFYKEKLRWRALDAGVGRHLAFMHRFRRGEVWTGNRDLAGRFWTVAYTTDDASPRFYLYDAKRRHMDLLFCMDPRLDDAPLVRRAPVTIRARDGLVMHGYFAPSGWPRPGKPPMILLVHGGPYARDTWGYEPWAQWLANRGYAVLQVNYRGSDGYGKRFLNAGNLEMGGRMQTDLVDAVRWAVRERGVDPRRIGIFGGSYGGYAVLAGLAFTPRLFAAGVDICGPSRLVTFVRKPPDHLAAMKGMIRHRMGDPVRDRALLDARSPLYHASKMRAPLLVGQGENDPRVRRSESDRIVAAMRRSGRAVEYLLYRGEGHGFANFQNNVHFHARAESFLARHLGGRCEPVGTIEGHTAVEM
ncbi:MAG: S9 family peptidase [Candidatus Coatesbacteria bacterium]